MSWRQKHYAIDAATAYSRASRQVAISSPCVVYTMPGTRRSGLREPAHEEKAVQVGSEGAERKAPPQGVVAEVGPPLRAADQEAKVDAKRRRPDDPPAAINRSAAS
jgi:hypothetical protein